MSTKKDNFIAQSAARLKEIRIALGLSQQAAADLCDVSREIWGKYERGQAVPGGEVLFSFAAAGADVQYILTGVRAAGADLTPREAALLDNYRHSSAAAQDALDRTSAALAQPDMKHVQGPADDTETVFGIIRG
jgi:transcriptional regulator with XRE-family HTH domain